MSIQRSSHSLNAEKIKCPKCQGGYLVPLTQAEQEEWVPLYSIRQAGSLFQAVPTMRDQRAEIVFVCRQCEVAAARKVLGL